MLQIPVADGGGSDDERAVGDGFGDGLELFGTLEYVRRADGGARFAKRRLVGIHHAQMPKSEIAHGAGGRADIERVARGDENDAQAVELSGAGQGGSGFSSGRCFAQMLSEDGW